MTTQTVARQKQDALCRHPPIISSFSFSRRSSTIGVSRSTVCLAMELPGSSSSTCVGQQVHQDSASVETCGVELAS